MSQAPYRFRHCITNARESEGNDANTGAIGYSEGVTIGENFLIAVA